MLDSSTFAQIPIAPMTELPNHPNASYAEEFVAELDRLQLSWMVRKRHRKKLGAMDAAELHKYLSLPYSLRQETRHLPAHELAHFFIAHQLKLYRRLFWLSLLLVGIYALGFIAP